MRVPLGSFVAVGWPTFVSVGPTHYRLFVTFQVVDSLVVSFFEVPIAVGDPVLGGDSGNDGFTSIEIQRLANGSSQSDPEGEAYVALIHTPAGVDLYVDPTYGLSRDWFDSDPAYANLRRSVFHLTPVSVRHWEISSDRVRIESQFQLDDGRTVSLNVDQPKGNDRVQRQFIPNPAIEELQLLRFLEVDGFGLIRRSSDLSISIDGRPLAPARFRLPLGGRRRYAARYTRSCRVVGLNPSGTYELGRDGGAREEVDDEATRSLLWEAEPPLAAEGTPETESAGSIVFFMAIGIVGRARYSQRWTGEGQRLTLDAVEQNWTPPRRSIQLRVLAAMRRRRRAGLRWNWSGSIALAQDMTTSVGVMTGSQWVTEVTAN